MKGRYDCEVCVGRGSVRIRLHSKPSVFDPMENISPQELTARDYPCPECSASISEERVYILQSIPMTLTDEVDPKWKEAIRRECAHGLADQFLKRGLITFSEKREKANDYTTNTVIIATLGAVSPRHVASMEERISERQDEFAKKVVTIACAGISNWNSLFSNNSGTIYKDQAISEVCGALFKAAQ